MLKGITKTDIDSGRTSIMLLILRVSVACFMLTHGWGKFKRVISGNLKFGDPIGLGPELSLILVTSAEFLGSILIIIGLWTRVGAFLGAFAMGVAAFVAHADDPFGTKEKPLLFLVCYIFLLVMGAGKHSVDSKLK